MVLVCFICKKAFDDRMNCEYCCNNYMYNSVEARQVPDFEAYNITAKLGIIYVCKIEYFNFLLSNECERLLTINPKGPQTTVDQTCVCEEALNNIALQTWPDNGLISLKFPII